MVDLQESVGLVGLLVGQVPDPPAVPIDGDQPTHDIVQSVSSVQGGGHAHSHKSPPHPNDGPRGADPPHLTLGPLAPTLGGVPTRHITNRSVNGTIQIPTLPRTNTRSHVIIL